MMSGGNILTLQKLLGHSSVAVTMKYAHLAPDLMSDEIGKLHFERLDADVSEIWSRGVLATWRPDRVVVVFMMDLVVDVRARLLPVAPHETLRG
jgi:hypothetical protein